MADIVTTRIFQDGEKNITAQKLNDIVASSAIQPAFVSSKPSTSTIATTDNLLVLQTAGTYAKAPFQTVIDSVSAGINADAEIWKVRLRSFNSIGNPTFEVDQRTVGAAVTANGPSIDRWRVGKSAASTLAFSAQSFFAPTPDVAVPGTSFRLSRSYLRMTLTTAQASLAATDYLEIYQAIEGPMWRELATDVHSLQLIVRSSVAGLKFGVQLSDAPTTFSLVKLCTIPSANTWTLVQMPNLPVWPSTGNFIWTPGVIGYYLQIFLAAGSTYTAPANDTWQSGIFYGAIGQDNFASKPVNSTFDIAFVQHEPGAVCSTPMDLPFTTNYDQCLRYFYKTYEYENSVGVATGSGIKTFIAPTATTSAFGPFQFPKPLAKSPTITFYNYATGAANSIRDGFGTDHASASAVNPAKNGFQYLSFATATTGAVQVYTHFTADTGW